MNLLKVINSSTIMRYLPAVLLLAGFHVSYGVPTQTDVGVNEELMLEPTADFLALLGERIALEASVHGDSSQELEEQLYRIQAKLDNTLRGKEQDISETLQILAAILKKNNVTDDDADEYGF
uniref:Putative 13 kDa protein n=1 Tax=Ixodes ricinus TaxID=34613 RepID=A0A0K8R4M4_IXORI